MYVDYLLVPVTLHCVLFGLECVSGVQFLAEPENATKTYTYGSNVTGDIFYLDCLVDSVESGQKVSWFKNGEIISDGYNFRDNAKDRLVDVINDRYRINSYGTPLRFALQVRSVSPSTAEFDSGSYQCAVTWWQDDAAVPDGRSRTAEINIYVIPTSNYPVCRVNNPNGQDVITAERTTTTTTIVLPSVTHTLTCLSSQSTPVVGLFWFRNDQSEALPRENHGDDDNGLSYIAVDWIPSNNDGLTVTFICTLQHPGLSSDRNCSLNFNIQYAPIVTIDPTDVMVTEENDEVVLHCTQDANRQVAESVWYYDDDVVNLVNGSSRFIVEEMSLRILNLHPRDNGVHLVTCKATNEEGTGNASASITVSIPLPTTEPSTQSSSTTMSTIGSSQGHRPTTPKEGLNIIAVVGGIVGAVLLILIGALVILVCFKIRKKLTPSQTPHDAAVTAKSNECDFDMINMINDVHAAHSSQAYATVNGAFDDDAQSTGIDESTEFNNQEKKEYQVDASADCTEDLYSKPKKKNKQGSNIAGRADNEQKTDTSTGNVPPPVPGKNFSENTQGSEAEDGQYANMRSKADMYQKLKMNSTPAEESAYPNTQHPVNKQTDSFYEEIPNSARKGYSKSDRSNAEGQLEEVKMDEKAALKNVEGLTYAELDLS